MTATEKKFSEWLEQIRKTDCKGRGNTYRVYYIDHSDGFHDYHFYEANTPKDARAMFNAEHGNNFTITRVVKDC